MTGTVRRAENQADLADTHEGPIILPNLHAENRDAAKRLTVGPQSGDRKITRTCAGSH